MLTFKLKGKLIKEQDNIQDQIMCDIDYDAFNMSELTIADLASAFGIFEDDEITLE